MSQLAYIICANWHILICDLSLKVSMQLHASLRLYLKGLHAAPVVLEVYTVAP